MDLLARAAHNMEATYSSIMSEDGIYVYLRDNVRPHPCAHAIRITEDNAANPAAMPLWVRYHVTTRPDQPGKLFWMGFNDRVFPGDWLVAYHCGSPFGLIVDDEAFQKHYTTETPLVSEPRTGPRVLRPRSHPPHELNRETEHD